MSDDNPTRVITKACILSYPHLMKPTPSQSGALRYQAELVFKDPADLKDMKIAASAAAKAKWGSDIPRGIKTPFDIRGEEFGYGEGSVFVRANSPNAPGCIVGAGRRPSTDAAEFYPGCIVMCELNASAYDIDDGKSRGVKFWLNSVWKIREGERLAPERNAASAFDDTNVDPAAFGCEEPEEVDSLL